MEQPRVIDVEPIGNCRLDVQFADGAGRIVDLTGLVRDRRAFRPLGDPQFFRRVRVNPETHSISWPGEIDIDPDALYGLEHRRGIRVRQRTAPRHEVQRPVPL